MVFQVLQLTDIKKKRKKKKKETTTSRFWVAALVKPAAGSSDRMCVWFHVEMLFVPVASQYRLCSPPQVKNHCTKSHFKHRMSESSDVKAFTSLTEVTTVTVKQKWEEEEGHCDKVIRGQLHFFFSVATCFLILAKDYLHSYIKQASKKASCSKEV